MDKRYVLGCFYWILFAILMASSLVLLFKNYNRKVLDLTGILKSKTNPSLISDSTIINNLYKPLNMVIAKSAVNSVYIHGESNNMSSIQLSNKSENPEIKTSNNQGNALQSKDIPLPTPTLINPSILHIDIYENEYSNYMQCNIALTYNNEFAQGAIGYIQYDGIQVTIPSTDALGKSEFNYLKDISVELVESFKGLVIDRYL